ncbi:hypothetical protein CcaverHIS002_0405200 [Cutaneotrichosporon cavernicola]|nr:hypothetical protein CcaverHIS002_0405200 [Cutaneotrichosporon cavernicola]BEI99471.1 hypothetical protein CcaverHIS631_0405140 [Cutaneotrichosporon cavernicola]
MSNSFPPQLERKNSDPGPYAPLLGSTAPPDSNVSQYQTGYYDRAPAKELDKMAPQDYRDPYSEPHRQNSDPYRQNSDNYRQDDYSPDNYRDPYNFEHGRYDERPYRNDAFDPQRRDEPDPFARSPSREARHHERAGGDPYAPDNYNAYGNSGSNGDMELRPMGPQKTNRLMTPPSALSAKDSLLFATGLDRVFRLVGVKMGESADQVVQRRRQGMPGQRWPVMAYLLTVIMCAVMVYELVANSKAQGSPISTKPYFNFMIGPSSTVLINIGARFAPCMRLVPGIQPSLQMACPSNTANPPTELCTVEEICGHGGFPSGVPDQSWRFFSPIFLHVGIIHLLVNMFAQVTMNGPMERMMGTIPWLIVYIAGGIYGNILGGSFSLAGIPSAGASGAIFAIAMMFALEFVLIFAMGYIPFGVDGLAHLGGFAMGLMLGIILVPSTPETKRYRMIVWGCRIVALPLAILAFALTAKNFYSEDPNAACTWCRYLSCIPTSANNQCKGTGLTMSST